MKALLQALLAALATGVPVDIGRDEARDAAAKELADPAYGAAHPSVFERALVWLYDRLQDLLDALGVAVPGGWTGLVVAGLLVVVLAVIVRWRVGKVARAGRRARVVFDGGPQSAAEYRAAAEEALSRGDLAEAVRERFRAIVRGLEERGVIDERSARTVDEAAYDAGSQLPGCAEGLRQAARMFDDVWYGGRTATAEGYQQLVALDAQVQAQRPTPVGVGR